MRKPTVGIGEPGAGTSATGCAARASARLARAIAALLCSLLFFLPAHAQPEVKIENISPLSSNSNDNNNSSSGRVNFLGAHPTNKNIYYAASEWGGLYKTTDGGHTWKYLDSHLPQATWDVEVLRVKNNRVIATSLFDGKEPQYSRSGIAISDDGGASWTKPRTARPAAAACDTRVRAEQMAAFGVSYDPGAPNTVYVGADCGLAISNDGGDTWQFEDPLPVAAGGGRGGRIVSVHAHHGVVDVCGDEGVFRRTGGGWVRTMNGAGECSITASPHERDILFLFFVGQLWYSLDGGTNWAGLAAPPAPETLANPRIAFVKTNDLGGNRFDLWFGNVNLWRKACARPAGGVGPRCPLPPNMWVNAQDDAHADAGDVAFSVRGDHEERCPTLYANDGGVYRNAFPENFGRGDCQAGAWARPDVGLTDLWLWDMEGVAYSNDPDDETIYIGQQDTGSFGTDDAGAATPAWEPMFAADVFDVEADENFVTNIAGMYPARDHPLRFWAWDPVFANGRELDGYPVSPPPPDPPNDQYIAFSEMDSLARFAPEKFAVVTLKGHIKFTTDIKFQGEPPPPTNWPLLGANQPMHANGIEKIACAIVASNTPAGKNVFTVKTWRQSGGNTDGCQHDKPGEIWQLVGVNPLGIIAPAWQRIDRDGVSDFTVFAVDPNDRQHMIAADFSRHNAYDMVRTTDGGATWDAMPELNSLMLGAGKFVRRPKHGPNRWRQRHEYSQPSLLAISPFDSDVMVAGGHDSGVFLSYDGGDTWDLISDPYGEKDGVAHIPRPFYAHFQKTGDDPNKFNIYIGTRGKGVFRINVELPVEEIEISGAKFQDNDKDGEWDNATEEPLRNWDIYVYADENDDGLLQQKEYDKGPVAETATNYMGIYRVGVPVDQSYIVAESLPQGWVQTAPQTYATPLFRAGLILDAALTWTPAPPGRKTRVLAPNGYIIDRYHAAPDAVFEKLHFGNYAEEEESTFTVSGVKFEDLNMNGVQDAGEPGLRDFWIVAYVDDGPADKTLSQSEYEAGPAKISSKMQSVNALPATDNAAIARVKTDFNGVYELKLNTGAAYLLFEEAHPDWLQNPTPAGPVQGIEFGPALHRNVPRGQDKNGDVIKLEENAYKIPKGAAIRGKAHDFLDFANYAAPGPRGEPCLNCIQEFCPPVEIVRGQDRRGNPPRIADLADWPERVPEAWPDEHEFGASPPPPSTYTYRFKTYAFTQNWMFASRRNALHFSRARVLMMDKDQDWTPEKVEIECHYATSQRDRNGDQMHLIVSPRPVTDQDHTVITHRTVSFRPWTRFYEQSTHDYEYNCVGKYDECKY